MSELGRFEEALYWQLLNIYLLFLSYDKAVKLKPTDFTFLDNKAFALKELGKYEEALDR